MAESNPGSERCFKTAWFAKAAKKAHIKDDELCKAIEQVIKGQGDDLGGGVFKKRLNKNMHRAIVLAKGGRVWLYVYLFAKKDRDNVEADELVAFRQLAKSYEELSDQRVNQLLHTEDITEICHDDKAQADRPQV